MNANSLLNFYNSINQIISSSIDEGFLDGSAIYNQIEAIGGVFSSFKILYSKYLKLREESKKDTLQVDPQVEVEEKRKEAESRIKELEFKIDKLEYNKRELESIINTTEIYKEKYDELYKDWRIITDKYGKEIDRSKKLQDYNLKCKLFLTLKGYSYEEVLDFDFDNKDYNEIKLDKNTVDSLKLYQTDALSLSIENWLLKQSLKSSEDVKNMVLKASIMSCIELNEIRNLFDSDNTIQSFKTINSSQIKKLKELIIKQLGVSKERISSLEKTVLTKINQFEKLNMLIESSLVTNIFIINEINSKSSDTLDGLKKTKSLKNFKSYVVSADRISSLSTNRKLTDLINTTKAYNIPDVTSYLESVKRVAEDYTFYNEEDEDYDSIIEIDQCFIVINEGLEKLIKISDEISELSKQAVANLSLLKNDIL